MDKGTRASNLILDLVVVVVLANIAQALGGYYLFSSHLFYFIYFLYSLIMEAIWGQTLGKMLSRTKVVDQQGLKPKFRRILWRFILRLYPFDLMSYVFGYEYGAHDRLSRTRIVFIKLQ